MEKKYTKRPWGIKGNLILTNVGSDDPCRIITIATVGQTYHEDVCNANAKLIAAAPESLEALEDLLAFCKSHNMDNHYTQPAENAIAKALN